MTEGGEWKKRMFREKVNQNEGSMNNPHRNLLSYDAIQNITES